MSDKIGPSAEAQRFYDQSARIGQTPRNSHGQEPMEQVRDDDAASDSPDKRGRSAARGLF